MPSVEIARHIARHIGRIAKAPSVELTDSFRRDNQEWMFQELRIANENETMIDLRDTLSGRARARGRIPAALAQRLALGGQSGRDRRCAAQHGGIAAPQQTRGPTGTLAPARRPTGRRGKQRQTRRAGSRGPWRVETPQKVAYLSPDLGAW
ncbi:MAG TPA: hypothetical protein VNO30_46915 [Kofleriaceae bacterium]|nr:hypothetical protein [Kofleriaceae bacterium]